MEHAIQKAGNIGIDNVSSDRWDDILKEVTEEYFSRPENADEVYKIKNSGKNEMLVDRIISFARHECKVISAKSNETGYVPALEEVTFGNKNSEIPPLVINCDDFDLVLNGKIDRIDKRNVDGNEQLAIIDYKGSEKNVSEKGIEEGNLLQLLAYKSAVENGLSKDVAGKLGEAAFVGAVAFYVYNVEYKYDGKKHTYIEVADESLNGRNNMSTKTVFADMKQLEKENIEKIREISKRISNGAFNIKPNSDKICSYCKYKNICGFNAGKEDEENEN